MGLDIRLPIGLMFTLFGVLLVVYGLVSDRSIFQRSLGMNVNLGWGAVLLIFGVVMLLLGRRGTSTAKPAEASVEGRKMMDELARRDPEGEHGCPFVYQVAYGPSSSCRPSHNLRACS